MMRNAQFADNLGIIDINSILAVIYLTKLQNLINRLVMNCSMNIFVYFYFSNDILFDFPSSGLIFLKIDKFQKHFHSS